MILSTALALLCGCGPSADTAHSAAALFPQVKEVGAAELQGWMTTGRPLTLIDVREDDEWLAGHAAAALHLSRWKLTEQIPTAVPDKTALIVLYCRSGQRSAVSASALQRLGYTNVYSLAGGLKEYERVGLPVER
jgi:rhodanese-related sulfurtransferase